MDPEIRQRLDTFIQKKGLRQTSQRDEIVETIFKTSEYFTPEQLFDRLRLVGSKASRATVYRTLALLEEIGLIQEIELGDDQKTYRPSHLERKTQNHLVCVDCGDVREIEDSHLDLLNDCVARRHGFTPVRQNLRIEAACDKLRKLGTCPQHIQARLGGKRLPNRRR